MARFLILTLLLISVSSGQAAYDALQFKTQQQEDDYKVLVNELRCLVCQNQNLADSDAELAQDLRKQVYTMLTEQGADRQAVVDYMVTRYGDFVLYRPPLKSNTIMLWVGPAVLLLLGFLVALKIIKGSSRQKAKEVDLSEIKTILDSKEKS